MVWKIWDSPRDANPPDFIGRLPKIHPNSRPYDHPPNPPEITIFFFFFFFFYSANIVLQFYSQPNQHNKIFTALHSNHLAQR